MKCNWEWLSAYLDGLLSDDKRAKLEEHLKTCEACAAKLEEFARVEQAAKKIPVPQLSEAYWENFASRVQNKLTIREKQRTAPAWLEALKSFFQPTTGKLAIAGSVVTILLVAIMGRDYWKKEAYQPPKFEAVAPPVNDKIDSVQVEAKDESAFRMARPDERNAAAEKKRENEIASAKTADEGIIESREDAPAALAPAEIASKPAGRQKPKEEPSLAGYLERDEVVQGDTALITAEKKAGIRKEVATSQVKVAAEEIGKLPIRNVEELLKLQQSSPPPLRIRARTQSDTLKTKEDSARKPGLPDSGIREYTLIKGGFDAQYGSDSTRVDTRLATQLSIDTSKTVDESQMSTPSKAIQEFTLFKGIAENERKLSDTLYRESFESLYISLANQYLQLYRRSLKTWDWNKANRRIKDFLKKVLSDSTRQQLLQIQAELKKLKK